MTNENAINILRHLNSPSTSKGAYDDFIQTIEMAIEALKMLLIWTDQQKMIFARMQNGGNKDADNYSSILDYIRRSMLNCLSEPLERYR